MSAKEQTDTPTPRTDAEIRERYGSFAIVRNPNGNYLVRADLARQLETELTALQADVQRMVEKYQAAVDDTNRSIQIAVENRVPQEYVDRHKECRDKAEEVVRDFKSLLPESP